VNRGDIWVAQVGRKHRPVLVLTRDEVIDVRTLITVAEITTSQRGIAVEVPIGSDEVDLDPESVVNCDGIHTIRQTMLTRRIGSVAPEVMTRICAAVSHAIGR